MSFCSKCGTGVTEEMAFCPGCGASLEGRVSNTEEPVQRRHEKEEKEEKREKEEKHEKRDHGFMGLLVGGLILVFIGFMFYVQVVYGFSLEILGALMLVLFGTLIIAGALLAARRHPRAR